MFYGVPGGLSGSGWGTQDANGVWSGWANGGQPAQAAYDPGQGAAFGGAADPYSGGGANTYLAGLPSGGAAPTQYSQPSYNPGPVQAPQPSAAAFGGSTGPAYSAPASTASFGGGGLGGGDGMMHIGGSAAWDPFTGTMRGAPGTQFASGAGGPGMGGQGSMPQNPYLPGIAGDITRRTTDMMNAGIRNARGGAIMAGGFGGSAQGIMEGKAISGASDNLAGQLSGLYGGAWNQDQSRDLQRYGLDQNFYGQQRAQDLQQAGLGASLLQNGFNTEWLPVQNSSNIFSGYKDFGSTTAPGSGGGWQGALGGALGGAQFAKNMGWFGSSPASAPTNYDWTGAGWAF